MLHIQVLDGDKLPVQVLSLGGSVAPAEVFKVHEHIGMANPRSVGQCNVIT
jgi:hypothetical protein